MLPIKVVAPGGPQNGETKAYSIGTLVRDLLEFGCMRQTFINKGFSESDCEYLYIDNRIEEQTSAYRGLNAILNSARGTYVILCHQDVRIEFDNRADLDARLRELSDKDPLWVLAGNAGGINGHQRVIRISDPYGENQSVGAFPARAVSLDENFIVVRREARLAFSNDLSSFHFYGTDICLHAEMLGYAAYVIDFHLRHLSPGRMGAEFLQAKAAFEAKWTTALRSRLIQTSCTQVAIGSSNLPARGE